MPFGGESIAFIVFSKEPLSPQKLKTTELDNI